MEKMNLRDWNVPHLSPAYYSGLNAHLLARITTLSCIFSSATAANPPSGCSSYTCNSTPYIQHYRFLIAFCALCSHLGFSSYVTSQICSEEWKTHICNKILLYSTFSLVPFFLKQHKAWNTNNNSSLYSQKNTLKISVAISNIYMFKSSHCEAKICYSEIVFIL